MASRSRALLVGPLLSALVAAGLGGPSFAAAAAAPTLDPGLVTSGHAPTKVVVSGAPGASGLVRAAVRAAGGTDVEALPIVHGWSARVPADQLAALDSAPGVAAVTADRDIQLAGNTYDAGDRLVAVRVDLARLPRPGRVPA